jgi:hypothetical protein
MIFSAVALVTFSFAGMANNGEVEKKNRIDLETFNNIEYSIVKIRKTPCADAWTQNYKSYLQLGYTPESANNHADWLFNACLESTYGVSMQ